MNEKQFVKLGDKYYFLVADEKGMRLEAATPEQLVDQEFDHIALEGGNEITLGNDNWLQDTVNKVQGEMISHLQVGIKQTVLNCLGFKKDTWGGRSGFEVDHCNSRMSEVGNHIKVKLQEVLGKTKIEDIGITEEERLELIQAFKKDLLDTYKSTLRQNLWRMVDSLAIEDAKHVANSLVKERTKEIGELVLEKMFKKKRP